MHQDKEQPAKKIRLSATENENEPKEKSNKIRNALCAVLSIPSLPINIFLHPLMRRFLQILFPKIELPRSFSSLKQLLLAHFVKVQAKIKDEVSRLHHRYSLTCDVWTDGGMNHAYLGVTLHYCDEAANLRCVFLGLQQLLGSHTGAHIRRETEKIVSSYGLLLSDAFKIVTDGGSNMVKGFSDIRKADVDPECIPDEDELDIELLDIEGNDAQHHEETEEKRLTTSRNTRGCANE